MYQIERTVGSSHMNTNGEMRLSAAVDFMQDCCCFQLDSEKELTNYFVSHNITMFLISRQINLIKPAHYGDRLLIRTSIYHLRTSYGFRNTMIYNDKEELLISSYAGGAFVNMNKGGSTIMPKEILRTITTDDKFEGMHYLPRKVSLPKENPEKIFPTAPVYHYYIDHNHHMNNARYLDVAQEYIPNEFIFHTCRIEYKTGARYEDTILPVRYHPEPGIWLISLQDPHGRIFANVEFRAASQSRDLPE